MQVSTGNLVVVQSGIARTGFSNIIKFDFDTIYIEVKFISDKEGQRHTFLTAESGKGLILTLFNFNALAGSGFQEPVHIGELEGRELWFLFEARKVNKEVESWSIEYHFFKGGRDD